MLMSNFMQRQRFVQKQNPYLVQKVLSASPEQLIMYIYDAAIVACARKDQGKAAQAMQELINALNFDERKIATTFYNMYQFILSQIHKKNYEDAKKMIKEIRETWAKAMNLT